MQIISGKDIKDKGFLDEIPKTYSYIVSGVKYENKWYYKKSAVTYFEAHNLNEGKQVYYNKLQSWNFFKDNSTEFNPEFWETELFKKVPDLTKDPKWDKYGKSIWQTDEINNRDYIGMYEIVAESLRDKIQIENNVFKTKTKQQFSTLYEKLKKEYPETYIEIDEHSLIFPTNKSVVINPAVIKSSKGVRTIHYFVLVSDKNEFYEWTYFNPIVVKEIFFGDEVVDQIGSLTNWNFSVDNLNDKKFWAESVLLKINDTYKYLKEIK